MAAMWSEVKQFFPRLSTRGLQWSPGILGGPGREHGGAHAFVDPAVALVVHIPDSGCECYRIRGIPPGVSLYIPLLGLCYPNSGLCYPPYAGTLILA